MATLRLIPASGAPIEITRDETLVGREPTCEIVVADGSVSRKHAKIERRGAVWMVVDQGSANGTFVDSRKVGEEALHNGQELRFGAVNFKVEIPSDEDFGATVANVPVLDEDDAATVMHKAPPAIPPPGGGSRAPGPPAMPKASPPPPPVPRPPPPAIPSAPPAPPSAAAARERFRPSPPSSGTTSPVPQVSADAVGTAPLKKGRGPLFWIVTGCCGCLVLVLLLVGVIGGSAFYLTKGAADAAHTVISDVKTGQLDKAYQGLSESYRAEMSLQDFEALITAHPGLKDNLDATFMKRSVSNDIATISGVLTSSSGPPEPVTFTLIKEGGSWKVTAIRFTLE